MKITKDDVDEIMKSIRATASEKLEPSLLATNGQLNDLITSSKYWTELTAAISLSMAVHSIEKGQTELQLLLGNTAQMGLMAGCLLGFQLGLREAGLEMGIGAEGDKS